MNRHWLNPSLAGLSLSMLMASLDTSIANAGLPTLSHAFGASFQAVQWIALSYLLAVTTLVVSVGRLGDMAGRRRLLVLGIGAFTAASVFCGLAPTLPVLIAARAVQGAGAAVMMALTLAFIGETTPKERIGTAMGLLGTMSAIGTALGPSLGGVMTAQLGWRSIFLVNLPVGLVALYMVKRHLPADLPIEQKGAPQFDGLGTVTLGLTLAAYALAMTVGHGSFGPLNLTLLSASLVLGGLFVVIQRRARSPLVRIETFRHPVLGAGLATSFLVSTVVMSTLVVGPFYLSRSLGLDTTQVGFLLSIGPLVVAISGVPAGRLADRYGASKLTVIGLVGIAVGSLLLSALPVASGLSGYVLPIVLITSGYAAFQTSNNTAVMAGIEPERRGVISGALNLSRNLGLITGASVMGAVFDAAGGSTSHPLEVSHGLRTTFAVAAGLIGVALALALFARKPRSARPADRCPCLSAATRQP